jgi:hypothetical protein
MARVRFVLAVHVLAVKRACFVWERVWVSPRESKLTSSVRGFEIKLIIPGEEIKLIIPLVLMRVNGGSSGLI